MNSMVFIDFHDCHGFHGFHEISCDFMKFHGLDGFRWSWRGSRGQMFDIVLQPVASTSCPYRNLCSILAGCYVIDFHDFHGFPGFSWIFMDFMRFHRISWISWKFSYVFFVFHGISWISWISVVLAGVPGSDV